MLDRNAFLKRGQMPGVERCGDEWATPQARLKGAAGILRALAALAAPAKAA